MKKKYIISALFLIFYVILSAAFIYADDRSYYVSSFDIRAELDPAGNMTVLENITYEFDGSFRGVYRTLKTAGSDGIDGIEIYKKQNGKLVYFAESNTEEENTYQILKEKDGIRLKIFSTSEDESKTFGIRYRVLNAAVKYNDTGELYWKFMGDETDVKTENFRVKITIPAGAAKDDIRLFGHGSLSGNMEILDGRNVLLTVEKLPPHNFVEARVLFPKGLIGDSQRVVNKDMLPSIMSEEERWAEEANARRIKARLALGFSFVFALFEILLIFYLYIKYDKEFKTRFDGEYFRELPGNYSPAVLSVLWNFGRVQPRDITATIMDLVRRKYLLMNVEQIEIKGVIKHKIENDHTFELNKDKDPEALSPHEKYLIDWLISTIGNGTKVSLKEIEQYSKSVKGAENFKADFDAWGEYVKREAEGFGFFDRNTMKGQIYGVVTAVAGMVYGGYTAAVHRNVAGFLILLAVSFILLVYSLLIKRRSKSGAEQYKMWKAFKRFLMHFSRLDKANLPAVTIWEYYLVYAITLGVAKEVIKQLRLVFSDEDFKNGSLTFLYYGHYSHNFGYFDTIEHVTDTMVKTTESAYTQAMSKLSSKSGRGGGFSTGGGGGGGGGGAGAF